MGSQQILSVAAVQPLGGSGCGPGPGPGPGGGGATQALTLYDVPPVHACCVPALLPVKFTHVPNPESSGADLLNVCVNLFPLRTQLPLVVEVPVD